MITQTEIISDIIVDIKSEPTFLLGWILSFALNVCSYLLGPTLLAVGFSVKVDHDQFIGVLSFRFLFTMKVIEDQVQVPYRTRRKLISLYKLFIKNIKQYLLNSMRTSKIFKSISHRYVSKKLNNSTNSSNNSSLTKDSQEGSNRERSIERPSKTLVHKHKTELCKTFSELGSCRYGEKCRFAHGHQELKMIPLANENYRKRKCKGFWENNECKYGLRCQFDHQKMDWTDSLVLNIEKQLLCWEEEEKGSRLLTLLHKN